ncbi:MAG: DDE-type integrase/transposase/recombinase [Candidatus Woesearchaeota archaeon]
MAGNHINPKNNKINKYKKFTELKFNFEKQQQDRSIRAYSLLAKGDIPLILNKNEYYVPSQSDINKKYKVIHTDKWECECLDFKHKCEDNGLVCKHIQAIQFYLKLKNKVEIDDLNLKDETNKKLCPYCNSENVVKFGIRKNKFGNKQKYSCKECNKKFVLEPIKYIKGNAKLITLTMDLYYKGLSLRDIKDTFKQFYNFDVTHETIRRWIRKFTKLMNEYTEKFKPQLSEKWHIDEQNIKVGREWLWSWNVLDEDTRFLVANNVTKSRYINDVKVLLDKTKDLSKPKQIVTDGLQGYKKTIKKYYGYNQKLCKHNVEHIRINTIKDNIHNNLIERYNNEFREFDKVRRGFGNKETAQEWTEGFALFHNFIKKGIDGLTPSERAKIPIILNNNRWLDLLKISLEDVK